jgi:hypothetical protein
MEAVCMGKRTKRSLAIMLFAIYVFSLPFGTRSAMADLEGMSVPAVLATGDTALSDAIYLLELDGSGSFIHFPAGDSMFRNTNAGRHPELARAMALATLGRALAEGNRTPAVVDTYMAAVSKVMSDPYHMPDMDAGLDARQHNSFIAALALGWNQPDIRAAFSAVDRERISAFAKAGVVASSFVYANYMGDGTPKNSGQRVSMDGDTNTYSSPNYSEAIMGLFISSSMILDLNQVPALLDGYDHADFLTELSSLGLTDVYDTFAQTFQAQILAVQYDAGDAAKKAALVNSTVNGITWNDGQGRPFWRGLTLGQIVSDPVLLLNELIKTTFTETATEGDYIGRTGRAFEFNARDGEGTRDSLSYSAISLPNAYISTYLLQNYGYWNASGETALKQDIGNRMLVGSSDIQGKANNGYWSLRRGKEEYDNLATGTAWYFPYTEALGQSLGFMKEFLYGQHFENGLPSDWLTVEGSWGTADDATWSGSTVQLEKVLAADAAAGNGILLTPYSGADMDFYAPVKISAPAAPGSGKKIGIIGRYTDASNYYLLTYAWDAAALRIERIADGISSVLAEKPFQWETGKVYQVKGSFAGSSIKLFVNGDLQLQALDAALASGYAGLASNGVAGLFDDIYITATGELRPMAPRAPASLSAGAAGGVVHLVWDAVYDAASYNIKRSGTSGGPYTLAGTATVNQFSDPGLPEDETGYYVVTAANAMGESGSSVEVAVSHKLSLLPEADATLRGGSNAGVNYGTAATLDLKASGSANYYREAVIQFDLASLAALPVAGAKLKLYVRSSDSLPTPVPVSVYAVYDDQWTEGGVTYATKPAAYELLDTVPFTVAGSYLVWDVSGFVAAQAAGDRKVSFLIKDSTYSDKSISFSSRQSASNKPVLEIGF